MLPSDLRPCGPLLDACGTKAPSKGDEEAIYRQKYTQQHSLHTYEHAYRHTSTFTHTYTRTHMITCLKYL